MRSRLELAIMFGELARSARRLKQDMELMLIRNCKHSWMQRLEFKDGTQTTHCVGYRCQRCGATKPL